MTTILEDIGDYLETNLSWAVLTLSNPGNNGKTLWLSNLPDKPDAANVLYQYGDAPPDYAFGGNIVWEKVRIQFLARDTAFQTAESRAYEVFNLLGGLAAGATINGNKYLTISALTSPAEQGPDSAKRQRVYCQFRVWRAR